MRKELLASAAAFFPVSAIQLWQVVTNNEDTAWRSDLIKVEIKPDGSWVEYTKDGCTQFTICCWQPMERYGLTMENKHFSGMWEGCLQERADGTQWNMTEIIYVKSPFLAFIARHFWPLEKIQQQYLADLSQKLLAN